MGAQWNVINQNYKKLDGYKRVAWPPVSEERIVREFTPQPQRSATPLSQGKYSGQQQQQYQQHQPQYNQQEQQQQQPQASVPAVHQQFYRAQSYDRYQSPYQQPPPTQQVYGQPEAYAPQWSPYNQQTSQPPYQQPPIQQSRQQQISPYHQTPQKQSQAPCWVNQQVTQQQRYQAPANKFQPQYQQPYEQPQPISHQYQSQYDQHHEQTQYYSHSQPQRPQSVGPQTPQSYREASPGMITLRNEAPITQVPPPVFTSQPAALSYGGGSNMRGDLKWPPPEYKEQAARENEERRKIAQGPVCRPRRVHRDYTAFFAKNATNCYYPSYKVPPGTQHTFA